MNTTGNIHKLYPQNSPDSLLFQENSATDIPAKIYAKNKK